MMRYRKDSKSPTPTWIGRDSTGFIAIITLDRDGGFRGWTNMDILDRTVVKFNTLQEAKDYFS